MLKPQYIALFAFLVVVAFVYFAYRQGKKRGQIVTFPNNGTGIPVGWSPRPVVESLLAAMQGFGTDETAIWDALEGLTDDQLAAVYNDFNTLLPDDQNLFEWFRSELSGDELKRALNYFKFIK